MPVSVSISKSPRTSEAMPKIPNCEGVKTLANTAVFRKDKIRVTILKPLIHETPFITWREYPITNIILYNKIKIE